MRGAGLSNLDTPDVHFETAGGTLYSRGRVHEVAFFVIVSQHGLGNATFRITEVRMC